jgi:hypothetical protein
MKYFVIIVIMAITSCVSSGKILILENIHTFYHLDNGDTTKNSLVVGNVKINGSLFEGIWQINEETEKEGQKFGTGIKVFNKPIKKCFNENYFIFYDGKKYILLNLDKYNYECIEKTRRTKKMDKLFIKHSIPDTLKLW